jgi:Lamin Tail Domain
MPVTHLRFIRFSLLLGCSLGCSTPPAESTRCKSSILAGDLVITEVLADPSGADDGKEWFEIFNASSRELDLQGVVLRHGRSDGSRGKVHEMRSHLLSPSEYLVLGNSLPDLLPSYAGYGYGADLGGLFNSEAGKVALACDGAEVDAAEYVQTRSGHSRAFNGGVDPDYTANDVAMSWCESTEGEFESGNFGTPGLRNQNCEVALAGRCSEGNTTRDTVTPVTGDLVITELMPSPTKADDSTGEWIELQVNRDVDLNGLSVDRLGDRAAPSRITSPSCLRARAGSLVVLARSRDAANNGMLPQVDAVFNVTLTSGTATAPGDVQLLIGATVLDSVQWTHSSDGKALQLDPDYIDAAANDDERVFCNATTAYGNGDLGTPGSVNEQCVILPPAGMCAQGSTIRGIDKPRVGQVVITEFMANPAGVDSDEEWFEVKNTGVDTFDLNSLGLDRAGDGAPPSVVQFPDCKTVQPGAFALFARSSDPSKNGKLPPVDATYSFSSGEAGDIRVLDGSTVLDAITWIDAPSGASGQLDPGATTVDSNDLVGNFCASTGDYGDGRNKGSPGAANGRCP